MNKTFDDFMRDLNKQQTSGIVIEFRKVILWTSVIFTFFYLLGSSSK